MIRKAKKEDIERVVEIYDHIHDAEEKGAIFVGWNRKIYPTKKTAEAAVDRDDLYVMIDDVSDEMVATAIINKIQVDVYKDANWKFNAQDDEVMVLHTLIVDPNKKNKGYGRKFVEFYENLAKDNGCKVLRIDTNEKNTNARQFYKKINYREAGVVPCEFNGLKNVHLVLLEKQI